VDQQSWNSRSHGASGEHSPSSNFVAKGGGALFVGQNIQRGGGEGSPHGQLGGKRGLIQASGMNKDKLKEDSSGKFAGRQTVKSESDV